MTRKRWTAKTEITDHLIKSREKRKWQIALRRYIIDGHPSSYYAPFFGLDIAHLRSWIELQFSESTTWEQFSSEWQLDHIIPVAFFDFNNEEDMQLCWNFVNISVLHLNTENSHTLDLLGAKKYFTEIFKETGNIVCKKMIKKVEEIENHQIRNTALLTDFINTNNSYINTIANFSSYQFSQLNSGVSLEQIVEEDGLLKNLNNL